MSDRPPRRRRVIALAATSVCVALLFVGMLVGASPMAKHGRALASDCGIRLGDPRANPAALDDCRTAAMWLAIPSMVPWTREDARTASLRLDEAHAAWRLRHGVVEPQDAAERSAAARRLLALATTDPRVGKVRDANSRYVKLLKDSGACREIMEADGYLFESEARNLALLCSLQLGDLAAAVSLARSEAPIDSGDFGAEYDVRRAAILCLENHAQQAAPVLEGVIAKVGSEPPFRNTARVAAVVCGPNLPVHAVQSEAWSLRTMLLHEPQHARILTKSVFEPDYGFIETRHHPSILAAAFTEQSPSTETTAAILSRQLERSTVSGPWQLVPDREYWVDPAPIAVYPEDMAAAADRIDAIALREETEHGDRAAMFAKADPTLEDHSRVYGQYPHGTNVPDAFRAAADNLHIMGAEAWARMGRADRARDMVLLVLRRNRSSDVLARALSVLMLADDWSTAQKVVTEHLGTAERTPELLIAISWVDMHAGRWSRVIERLQPLCGHADDAGKAVQDTAVWMVLAAHAGLGTRPNGQVRAAASTMTSWKAEAVTGRHLMRAGPAIMFVRSAEVPTTSDVEVWLDARTPNNSFADENVPSHRLDERRQPIGAALYARIRAEAARYRGDAKAEALWKARAAMLIERHSNPARSVVATIAGM